MPAPRRRWQRHNFHRFQELPHPTDSTPTESCVHVRLWISARCETDPIRQPLRVSVRRGEVLSLGPSLNTTDIPACCTLVLWPSCAVKGAAAFTVLKLKRTPGNAACCRQKVFA